MAIYMSIPSFFVSSALEMGKFLLVEQDSVIVVIQKEFEFETMMITNSHNIMVFRTVASQQRECTKSSYFDSKHAENNR